MSRTWRGDPRARPRACGPPCPSARSAATACTPRLAIVAPTAAICSGVARSRSWPIDAAPTARSSLRSRGKLAGHRVGHARLGVEAEALGGRDHPLAADLRAERGEHGVAGVRERLGQRAAARLVARVAQLDARQRRGRAHRIDVSTATCLLGLQRGGERDDLERRAGRLGRRGRQAAEREHRAVARAQHGDAAEPVAERGDRRALQAGPDRRAHGAAAARLRARDPARAEAAAPRSAARRAGRCRRARGRSPGRRPPAACRRSPPRSARGPGAARRRRAPRRGAASRGSCRRTRSPGRRPGSRRYGRQRTPTRSPTRVTGSAIRPRSVPNSLVRTATAILTSPVASPRRSG